MSANLSAANQIKLFWDHFFYAETGTYEKSSWLDLFLAEFLTQLKDGCEVSSILSFCPLGGIVTLVGCELLCGVHCVTSSSCAQYLQLARNDCTPPHCLSNFQLCDKLTNKCNGEAVAAANNVSVPHTNIPSISFPLPSSIYSLQKYVLKGSAWRCLALLQALGVEGLSCSRQLSGVLVWLYGELSGSGGVCHGPNPYLPRSEVKPDIHELFINKIWIRQKIRGTNFSRRISLNGGSHHERSGNQFSRSRRKTNQKTSNPNTELRKSHARRSLFSKNKVSTNKDSYQSSDSEHNSDELELLNRSFTLKARYNPHDFDYFTSVVRSDDDKSTDSFYSPLRRSQQKKKPSVEDYITDRHREILKSEISQFEFSEMAINLLYKLCKAESNTSGSEALHINVQCVNFAVRFLCTLQFESSPASRVNLTQPEVAHLKASLTELLMVSFDKIFPHPDLFIKIIHNGLLPMLVRLLEDSTYKLSVRFQPKEEPNEKSDYPTGENNVLQEQSIESEEATDLIKYLFGISYTTIVFFYCLLMQHRSLDKIHNFTEQFKLFGDCRKGQVLKESISLILRIPGIDKTYSINLVKKLLDLLSRLIGTMKLVRSEVVHSASCSRSRHKMCRPKVSLMMQHHHDILGTCFCHSGNMGLTPVCSVATLYATLTSLLNDEILTQSASLRSKLLRCMRICGSCCCFSPHFLLDRVIRVVRSHHGLANLCFSVLEQTLYGELGAIKLYQGNEPCATCERYFVSDDSVRKELISSVNQNREIRSRSSSSNYFYEEGINRSIVDVPENRAIWPFLSKYLPLLQIEDYSILHATMSHLLRMSVQCKEFVKHDLLFCILYPAFLTGKKRYLLTNGEPSYFVTLSCLNSFSSLLSRTAFAEEFIQIGGLTDILELMALPEFSKQCCSILEITAIVEIFNTKLDSNGSAMKMASLSLKPSEIESLSSLRMLFKSLDDVTNKAFKYFKLKIEESVFIKLMDLSDDKDAPFNSIEEDISNSDSEDPPLDESAYRSFQKKSQPINIKDPNRSHNNAVFEMQFSSLEQTVNHHSELLKNIWTFWRTCSALCLYCPILRKYLVRQKIFRDSYKMLKLLLHCICFVPCTLTENKIHIKILESIISINLSVSDCTMDRSKRATLALLKDVLLNEKHAKLDLHKVKSLCEMLIRTSTIQASAEQVMPPVNRAKLPPLLFSANSDDESPSSGDDDDDSAKLKPYMSEGSDPYYTAEEGYDADVEMGMVDQSSPDLGLDNVFTSENVNKNLEHSTHSTGSQQAGPSTSYNYKILEYREYRKINAITHPELCVTVVDVLLDLIERILKSIGSSDVDPAELSQMMSVVSSCIGKLSTSFHQDINCSSGNGLVTQILSSPAVELLRKKSTNLEDLQRSLLKLIYTLSSKSIDPSELKLYLEMFTSPETPLNVLLEPLCELAEKAASNIPDFIVCFPIDRFPKRSESSTSINRNKDVSQIEQFIKTLHHQHQNSGINSPWSEMGLWCPIEGVNWGLWLQGCSVSVWLRVQEIQSPPTKLADSSQSSQNDGSSSDVPIEKSSFGKFVKSIVKPEKNQPTTKDVPNLKNSHSSILHMMSIGHDSLILEFWINTKNGDLLVKLTRPEQDNILSGETLVEGCLPLHQWNHLAMNIKEVMQKRKISIEITIFVNGSESHTVTVPLNGILLRKARPAYFMLGHTTRTGNEASSRPMGSWYLSSITVFRAPVLTRPTVLYLMAFGPNVDALSSCQVGNLIPNFIPLFVPDIVSSNLDWDQILDLSSLNVRELQENLLLKYSAHNLSIIDIYHQNTSNPSVFGGLVPSMKVSASSVPVPITANWTGLALPSQHKGLLPSVYLLGGPHILLFLFARVVEMNGSAEEQGKALSLLLRVSFSDTRLHSVFQQDDLLNMLQTVFASEKCHMGYHFLKAMLDAACNTPILSKDGNKFNLVKQTDVIIVCPQILDALLKAWIHLDRNSKGFFFMSSSKDDSNHVEKCERESKDGDANLNSDSSDKSVSSEDGGGLLGSLLFTMEALLRDDHQFRSFNVYQMNRVNMVECLLMFCKERFLNSDMERLSDAVSCSLVELIRSLMGSPPIMHHVALLTDFLVLMHQASATFITHSRSSFYFLLTDITQSSSNYNSNLLGLPLPFTAKRRNRKNPRRRRLSSSASYSDRETLGTPLKNMSLNQSDRKNPFEDVYEMVSCEQIADIENTPVNDNQLPTTSPLEISKATKTITNLHVRRKTSRKEKRKRHRSRSRKMSSILSLPGTSKDGDDKMYNLQTGKDNRSLTDSPNSGLTKDYVVIESDEINPEPVQNDSISMYQQLQSPVLLHNLRTGSSRSWTVCEGLLLLLRDTICIMPDAILSQVFGVVLHTEMLLILGNHKEASVRTGVVKVICALIQRCSAEELRILEQRCYFYLLANQISQYPASHALVSACASLVTGRRASLEDQLEDEAWGEVTEKELHKTPPLLAILPCTLHDISLIHNTTLFFKKIIEKASIRVLNEVGIVETILKCLRQVGAIKDTFFDGRELVLDDLRFLLNQIALKTIVFQHNLQMRMDIHYLLCYLELMERSEAHIYSDQCHVASVMRDTQCTLFDSEFNFLEERLNALSSNSNTKNPNYFPSALSVTSGGSDSDSLAMHLETSPPHNSSQNRDFGKKLSRSELLNRHAALLNRAAQFLMNRDSDAEMTKVESDTIERVFLILISIISGTNRGLRSKWWNSITSSDWHHVFCDMFSWIISPATKQKYLKIMAIKAVLDSLPIVHKVLTPSDPVNQRKLAVYLTCALDGDEDVQQLYRDVWRCLQGGGPPLLADAAREEARHLSALDTERRHRNLTLLYANIQKSVFTKDSLALKLTVTAMSITRLVVDAQNSERKAFLGHLRRRQGARAAGAHAWVGLRRRATHERGAWPALGDLHGPRSWELDPAEGPGRARVRLRRCRLDIDDKFVKEGFRDKIESAKQKQPLSFLFEWSDDQARSGLLERLHLNESVSYMTRAIYVTVKSEQHGELLLSDRCIHFLPESGGGEAFNSVSGVFWPLDSITSVHTRRWQLAETAIEVFLSSGHAHLVAFFSAGDMDDFLKALNNSHLPNRYQSDTLSESANQWRNGVITNWEYLMLLNGWAGRTYNDLMQYPVFPFIIADYVSEKLDLGVPTSFRDLRKPMAVQDKKNEMHYINNYNYLKQARQEGSCLISGVNKEPYHYGSHYSNSGTVLHFLVRLPPFTKLFLTYQDNNFDIPDRTFHSLQTTWRLTSCDSTTDVKELIPEFFCLPHFLCNSENLELGVRQCGVVVNDVELPPWAKNARLFILINRQALESSYARENLPLWIDLVFGYKQTGQAAVDAVNVFHPATYYGFDMGIIQDDLERKAWETMVRTYGQTPRQLLKQPHPHSITDLQHIPEPSLEVLSSVRGLRWGSYCGSPQEVPPAVVWTRNYQPSVMKLIPLLTGEVLGVPTYTTLLITYSKSLSMFGNNMIGTIGVLTWGHSDGIIRIKQRKELPPEPLYQIHNLDQLCVVSHGAESTMGGLWLGLQSGRIIVLPPAPANSTPPTLNFSRRPSVLLGHNSPIVAMHICTAFGVAVSASEDGIIIVWDIHSFTYIRTIPKDVHTVSHVCVSDTLSDIVTVHQIIVTKSLQNISNILKSKDDTLKTDKTGSEESENTSHNSDSDRKRAHSVKGKSSSLVKFKSKVRVHTVNGVFVGEVKIPEKVTCVCYSNAPEGVSVNAVVVGLHSGAVRLFSSWDLKPIAHLVPPSYAHPLLSICYSNDSHYLYVSGADGCVMVWEGNNIAGKVPNFRILTSLPNLLITCHTTHNKLLHK